MTLGTILPTRASLAADEAYARDVARRQAETARACGLTAYPARREQGETRYYATPDRYAVASARRADRVLWFARRADGHFYAVTP
jgi:hypothetical protein